MILMYGCDWGEWSFHETRWHPVHLSDEEVNLAINSAKDMIWPHKDAAYVVFPLNKIKVGDSVGSGSFGGGRNHDDVVKYKSSIKAGDPLFVKQRVYKDDCQYLYLDGEIRVFEDLSFVICLKLNLPKSSSRPNHSFIEFAYNENEQRWESLMKHHAEYPHDVVEQIELEIEKSEGFNYANE